MIYTPRRRLLSPSLSGYVRASTDNPNGWRPQYTRLGELQREPVRARPRYIHGLGDPGQDCDFSTGACSPCDTSTDPNCVATGAATDQTAQLNQIQQYFIQANNEQISQEQAEKAAGAAQTPFSSDLVNAINQNRTDMESALANYNILYRAAFGSVQPIPGLQGLGIAPVLIAAGALVVIVGAIVAVIQHQANTRAQIQVQQQQAGTQQTLANQVAVQNQILTDAIARGDTATATQAQQNIATLTGAVVQTNPNQPQTWSSFLQNNWGWMAAAAVGVIAVSKL